MENSFRELQKQEAITRLKILEDNYLLHKNVLKEFEQNGTIYYSENINEFYQGMLFWLSNKKEYENVVKKIEKEWNIFVYHCIFDYKRVGKALTMLYVSSNQEEWEIQREELLDGNIVVYTYNFEDNIGSEFGRTVITGVNGGLKRIY